MATPRPVPQLPWGWRSMWVIAMFDLPTETPAARRAYSQFRKHLLEDGFTMMQFSVYARHCANIENSDMHVKRMGELAPPEGEVRFLAITDRRSRARDGRKPQQLVVDAKRLVKRSRARDGRKPQLTLPTEQDRRKRSRARDGRKPQLAALATAPIA
jgi:CRISPR-associated protein Cas2